MATFRTLRLKSVRNRCSFPWDWVSVLQPRRIEIIQEKRFCANTYFLSINLTVLDHSMLHGKIKLTESRLQVETTQDSVPR